METNFELPESQDIYHPTHLQAREIKEDSADEYEITSLHCVELLISLPHKNVCECLTRSEPQLIHPHLSNTCKSSHFR